jgi:hypothetical protein
MPQVTQAAPFKPLPASNIQANMGPQFGPTATPNPYVAGNTPAWAQGHFAMPWWGLDPFGQPLTQEQMMYQAPPPPLPQEPAQAPQAAASSTYRTAGSFTSPGEAFRVGNLSQPGVAGVRAYNNTNDPYLRYLYDQGRQQFEAERNRTRWGNLSGEQGY